MPFSAERDDPQQHLNSLAEDLERGRLSELNLLLKALTPAEIADLLEALPLSDRLRVWRLLPPETAGEVLVELGDEVRASLIRAIEQTDLEDLVQAAGTLDPDDLAYIIEELPEKVREQVVRTLSQTDRRRLEQVLSFPEDTAGSLMHTDTLTVRPDVTLDVVLRYLRRRGELPDLTDSLYVVDGHDHLLGILPFSLLLTSSPKKTVRELMLTQVEAIPAELPSSEVAMLFEHHDWISAPVVDEQNRLLGRITVNDVVDIIRDEANHAFMGLAGLSEETDMFAPALESAKKRAAWLGINLLTAFLAAAVIGQFETTIQKEVALAVLMPIVAGMGGNAGIQTQTLVIRGLALKQIGKSNLRTLFAKELAVALLNGILWALLVGVITLAWFGRPKVALTIAAAMIVNLSCAALAGVTIPWLLHKLKVDPAIASGIFLTTVTDVIGFIAFLGLATWWLF